MIFASVAAVILLISEFRLSEGNCSPDLYYDFMECVHGHIKEEWASLITDPDQHISKQEATMKKCFKNGKCEDELDFDKPVEEHLSKDVRNMVGLMQEFWYALPVGMQTCILTNARDGFFEDLQTCVNKKGLKEYKTKKFGPFPMPDAKLFSKDLLPKLIKRNDDKVIAALSADKCDSPKGVISCTENATTTLIRQCFKKKLCSDTSCKGSIKKICVEVDKCVPLIVSQFVEQMSNLDDSDNNNYIKKMDGCEKKEQQDHPEYLYSRVKAIKIYKEFKRHQNNEENIGSFKRYLDEMVKGYLDIHSICSNTC